MLTLQYNCHSDSGKATWDSWSSWNSCSRSCNGGTRSKLELVKEETVVKAATYGQNSAAQHPALVGYLIFSAIQIVKST